MRGCFLGLFWLWALLSARIVKRSLSIHPLVSPQASQSVSQSVTQSLSRSTRRPVARRQSGSIRETSCSGQHPKPVIEEYASCFVSSAYPSAGARTGGVGKPSLSPDPPKVKANFRSWGPSSLCLLYFSIE